MSICKWWSLVEVFCLIIDSFSPAQSDSLPTILTQLSRALDNPEFQTFPGLKTQDLVAWAVDGQGGWFGIMYNRMYNLTGS
jgi:hypothetical protein